MGYSLSVYQTMFVKKDDIEKNFYCVDCNEFFKRIYKDKVVYGPEQPRERCDVCHTRYLDEIHDHPLHPSKKNPYCGHLPKGEVGGGEELRLEEEALPKRVIYKYYIGHDRLYKKNVARARSHAVELCNECVKRAANEYDIIFINNIMN